MPKTIRLVIFVLLALLAAGGVYAQKLYDAPVEIRNPVPPTPVPSNGTVHLFYELHLTNLRTPMVRLESINVADQGGRDLIRLEAKPLADDLWRPGLAAGRDKRDIDGGSTAVVFIEITSANGRVPRSLTHRLTFNISGRESVIDGVVVPVSPEQAVIISPPLRGNGWIALSGLSNTNAHRRTVVVVDGQASIAQRFATDWTRVGADGLAFRGDPAINANWSPYGAEVFAVGGAVVTDVKDGIPENDPTSDKKAVPIDLSTVGGNYIILRLRPHVYAFYAHLKPGSIRVRTGQRVTAGQTIALLGNSGQADAPHLHFHLMDQNSPLRAEGIPYVFRSYLLEGTLPSKQLLVSGGWHAEATRKRVALEQPRENDVVDFPR